MHSRMSNLDPDELASLVRQEFGCQKDVAEKIANHAVQYHKKSDSDKTAEDWIAIMKKREDQTAAAAWNWAVGFVGFPGPSDTDQFQLQ